MQRYHDSYVYVLFQLMCQVEKPVGGFSLKNSDDFFTGSVASEPSHLIASITCCADRVRSTIRQRQDSIGDNDARNRSGTFLAASPIAVPRRHRGSNGCCCCCCPANRRTAKPLAALERIHACYRPLLRRRHPENNRSPRVCTRANGRQSAVELECRRRTGRFEICRRCSSDGATVALVSLLR
jgi:hypothetical protein